MFTTLVYENGCLSETVITVKPPLYFAGSNKLAFDHKRQLTLGPGINAFVMIGDNPVTEFRGLPKGIKQEGPINRLMDELSDVLKKAEGLKLLIGGEDDSSLTEQEKFAVSIQLSALLAYVEALNFRISLHSN